MRVRLSQTSQAPELAGQSDAREDRERFVTRRPAEIRSEAIAVPLLREIPRPIKTAPPPDRSSFEAFTQRRDVPVNFPEAEWHQEFAENPDGSVGRSLMNLEIRRAITVDARLKPNFAGIRVPVLAMYQAQLPFEEVAAEYDIRNEQERAALRQQYAATRALYGVGSAENGGAHARSCVPG